MTPPTGRPTICSRSCSRTRRGRADFMAALAQQGIQTSIHYPPVHLFSYYQSLWEEGHHHRLPLTEEIASRLVTLPLYPSLTMAQLDTVVAAIHAYFR